MTLPDGQHINYQYDQLRLKEIQVNGNIITQLHHDEYGRETDRQQGQLTTHSDYDPMGLLIKQQAVNQASKQSLIQREYGYDPFNNLNTLKDGTHETHYLYDELNRLKQTEQDGLAEQFDFDPAGNIVAISEQNQQENKLAHIKGNRPTLQGDKKFEYDQRGNLIKETRGKGGKLVTEFEYNLQNQLTAVTKNGQTTHYKYDPLGRRFEKQDTFGTTRYLWAENQLVQETRNNIKKTYVYEPHSFKPVALIQDEQIYHYHLRPWSQVLIRAFHLLTKPDNQTTKPLSLRPQTQKARETRSRHRSRPDPHPFEPDCRTITRNDYFFCRCE